MVSHSVDPPVAAAAGAGVTGHLAGWRARSFGPASEEPYRRRTVDAVRLVVATTVVGLLAAHTGNVTDTERAVFDTFNTLPGGLHSLFRLFYSLGALWALALVFAAALVARRMRLARDLALAGFAAWVVGRVLGELAVVDAGVSESMHVVVRLGHDTPSFPFVRLAVVAAVVAAAAPYLSRPSRRLGGILVVALGLAAMYLGRALPDGVVGALALGWGLAALVHLVFGSPGGRPTSRQVAGALDEMSVDARDVHLAPSQPVGVTLMLGEGPDGALRINVIGRDDADNRLVAKLGRALLYRDSGPPLALTRLQQVEHQAYAMLLAREHGVMVPDVVRAGSAGPGAALLVERECEGTVLDELGASIDDGLLDELWRNVARLHDAGVAHGALNARHVLVTPNGPVLVGFTRATTSTVTVAANRDVAELLTSTAGLVGEDRAVAAACRGAGSEAVEAALPMLQVAALTRETRRSVPRKELRTRLDALRAAGAAATGTEAPPVQELHRVSGTNLLMAIGTLIAAAVLLGQVGSPAEMWDTVTQAEWYWLVIAIVLSLATNVGYAIALMGTVPVRLPLGPTTEVQVAMSFSNLAIPAVGGTALQIRYLQKQGVDLASAVAAGGFLSVVAGTVVQIGMFLLALALAPDSFRIGEIPTGSIVDVVLLVVLVVGVGAAVVAGVPRVRRTVVPPVAHALATLWTVVRSPRLLALLVGGNIAVTLVYGLCLLACLEAFGGSISFWTLLAVNLGVSTIAQLVPVPGGGTAISSVGLSGALTGFGVPTAVAVAAVLTNQLVVSYLPALPGWFATRDLMRRDYL